jgi:hypothetical protein
MLNAHQKVSNCHCVSVLDHGAFDMWGRNCRLWPSHLRFLLTSAPAGAGDRHHV